MRSFPGWSTAPVRRRARFRVSGLSNDAVRSVLDNVTQGQSVMLATNEIMSYVAIAFCLAALIIWLAPRPTTCSGSVESRSLEKRSDKMEPAAPTNVAGRPR